ncbi:unnamed protein product [Periconia digitata]|uniref:Uncharacterized protein n=1 Tax=Periconia digitata TaxID=1303443 RepID=A0A9W4UAI4_9PLEO|nr:unnamed protein product [Periconia digitata]
MIFDEASLHALPISRSLQIPYCSASSSCKGKIPMTKTAFQSLRAALKAALPSKYPGCYRHICRPTRPTSGRLGERKYRPPAACHLTHTNRPTTSRRCSRENLSAMPDCRMYSLAG